MVFCSGVASGYPRYSLNTLQFSEKIKIYNVNGHWNDNFSCLSTFSTSQLQYNECWSYEALREKEELHVKLKSVTNTQWIPWTVFSESKCFILIYKFFINRRKQWQWTQKIVQRTASVSDWATVARSHSLTSKLIKAIIAAVEKDVKVCMEELKESSVVMYFSVNNL